MMIDYLLELFIIHSTLTGIYLLFFSNESDYSKMRLYLISSTLIALFTPLLKLPEKLFPASASTASVDLKTIILQPVVNGYMHTENTNFELIIQIVYWLGVGILSILFLTSLFQVGKLIFNSKHFHFHEIRLFKTNRIERGFTFFNWILIEESFEKEPEQLSAIVAHEKAHSLLHHTYDILFFQLFKIFFWWLPSAWYSLQAIKNVHEYQADQHALKSVDAKVYSNLLISSTLKSHGLSVATSFDDGSIFKRITKMKQQTKKLTRTKALALSSISIIIIVFFACTENLDKDIQDLAQNSYESSVLSQEAQALLDKAKELNPDTEFKYLEYILEGGQDISSLSDKLNTLDQNLIESVNVNKEEGIIGIILREKIANNYTSQINSNDEIYTLVDEKPSYTGGMQRLYSELLSAHKSILGDQLGEIEGRVYIQFIIEKDGSMSNMEVLKSSDSRLSNPALTALKQLKKWEPGFQNGEAVRVRMVLPVVYSQS